ncbi:hypothetical protein LPJ81_006356 [Coemansia sp. IMI 209127]|nr:hypothetical protein LPJ81_006356 [Coemansia sp. IMI 209127]
MNKAELAMRREVYWCQLDIASRVRIRWRCRQSGRSGYVDPRLFFVLGGHDLRVVRPQNLHVQVAVNGAAAERVDRGILQAKCATSAQSTLTFAFTNRLPNSLSASISVSAVSKEAGVIGGIELHGDPKEEDKHREFAADAYSNANISCSTNALATANVNLDFASSLPDSRQGFSKGRFVFRPAGGGLGTDGSLSAKDAGHHPNPNLLVVPPLPYPCGLSFDDVRDMRLPELSPGETQTIAIPLYILHPGRYQLEYKVSRKLVLEGSPGGHTIEDLVQDVLVIDGVGK